jgi:glutamine---fructose-6-phosphate transaminase (isomerizing)
MTTWMRSEALDCARVARNFLEQVAPGVLIEGARLAGGSIRHVEVLGRGSSSHAGTVLRYALASHTALTVSAAMPSTASVGPGSGAAQGRLTVAISQSGRSPDLLAYADAQRAAGARVLAMVNMPDSPLGRLGHAEVLLQAGPELSVAATKSTVAACLAGLALVAGHDRARGDEGLWQALQALPGQLDIAQQQDWAPLAELLPGAHAVFVVGRGATTGIAKEIALKICEATGVPALAFSSAEFLHGPLGAVGPHTPVIAFSADAAHEQSVSDALARAAERGARTLAALSHGGGDLPLPPPRERFTDAVAMLPPAYLAIEAAARQLGRDPDRPQGLAKVTQTV